MNWEEFCMKWEDFLTNWTEFSMIWVEFYTYWEDFFSKPEPKLCNWCMPAPSDPNQLWNLMGWKNNLGKNYSPIGKNFGQKGKNFMF